MPRYNYQCPRGHDTEVWRKMGNRRRAVACETCGKPARLVLSRTHCPPDGVYSYAPNVGDPARFERQLHAIKNGTKVIARDPDHP